MVSYFEERNKDYTTNLQTTSYSGEYFDKTLSLNGKSIKQGKDTVNEKDRAEGKGENVSSERNGTSPGCKN
jgi:hypothetical protein